MLATECKLFEEVEGKFNYNTNYEGLLYGNDRIKEIFKENESSIDNPKKFFRKYNAKKIHLLFMAPFRTSTDLRLNVKNLIKNNTISFDFNFSFSEISLPVLNQKFYLAILSKNCLIQIHSIPVHN